MLVIVISVGLLYASFCMCLGIVHLFMYFMNRHIDLHIKGDTWVPESFHPNP